MCTCSRPNGRAGLRGFGGQGATNGIRADPAVARTGQCADIGRMARVGLRWDTRHGIWVSTGRMVVR
jgi:hypothetical protein